MSTSRSFSHRIDDILFHDHWLEVPLNHRRPDGRMIRIYGREMVLKGKAQDASLPWAVYFQGGPGFASPRPSGVEAWMKPILEKHRLFLLDQRGTGRSSPLNAADISALGSPAEQAERLQYYRQDAIVADAEAFRLALGAAPWLAVGQSFGGWCITSYLSFSPEGLSGALIYGGLPPVGWDVDEVYRVTYRHAVSFNQRIFEYFPTLRQRLARLCQLLEESPATLPRGGSLSRQGLQQLGLALFRARGPESLFYTLELAFPDGDQAPPRLTQAFLLAAENTIPFLANPFFLLLHESIYANGPGRATAWSAERVRKEFPEFENLQEPLFTGEHMEPWMLDQFPGMPALKECALILAAKTDWPKLYDVERLAANKVPVAAIIYHDDYCVGYPYSIDCARLIGSTRTWVTSEFNHDGISVDGERISRRLLGFLDQSIRP